MNKLDDACWKNNINIRIGAGENIYNGSIIARTNITVQLLLVVSFSESQFHVLINALFIEKDIRRSIIIKYNTAIPSI